MPINLGIVSFGDRLVMSFSRIITDRHFIQAIVQQLTSTFQIPIRVYGNRWEEANE